MRGRGQQGLGRERMFKVDVAYMLPRAATEEAEANRRSTTPKI